MECKKCTIQKEILLFPKGRKVCIECTKKRKQIWHLKHAARERERSRLWKLNNPERNKIYKEKYAKDYWQKNKDVLKANNKKNWYLNKEKYSLNNKKWRMAHKKEIAEKMKTYSPIHHLKLKKDVLSAYSNGEMKCACCGEDNFRFLTLDHINNNGAEERRMMKKTGYGLYSYLRKNNYPQNGYRILCYNCNCGRQYNKGVCPHEKIN